MCASIFVHKFVCNKFSENCIIISSLGAYEKTYRQNGRQMQKGTSHYNRNWKKNVFISVAFLIYFINPALLNIKTYNDALSHSLGPKKVLFTSRSLTPKCIRLRFVNSERFTSCMNELYRS